MEFQAAGPRSDFATSDGDRKNARLAVLRPRAPQSAPRSEPTPMRKYPPCSRHSRQSYTKRERHKIAIPHPGKTAARRDARIHKQHFAEEFGLELAHSTARKMRQALVPPNPKELESANSTCRLRALCGTRSSSVSTEG